MRAPIIDGKPRPFIEVTLSLGGDSQDVWMLLDTGADTTTIPPDLARGLTGEEFDKIGVPGPPVNGIGTEPITSRLVEGSSVTYAGRTVAMRIMVAPIAHPVLGRDDFMRRFDARFYWSRTPPEFYVEPAQPPKSTGSPAAPNPTIRPKGKKRKR